MRSAETSGQCEYCGEKADYCDSVPDGAGGYRLKPLCWIHGVEHRRQNTSRMQDLIVADGVGHVDRGRAGGDVLCEECGRKLYDHPQWPPMPFLHILCDGSVVKL